MYFQPIGKNKSPNRCEHRKTDLKPPSNFPQDSPQQKSPHKKTFQHKNHTKNNKKHPKKSSQKIQATLFFWFHPFHHHFSRQKKSPVPVAQGAPCPSRGATKNQIQTVRQFSVEQGSKPQDGGRGGNPSENLGVQFRNKNWEKWKDSVSKHEKTHMVYM